MFSSHVFKNTPAPCCFHHITAQHSTATETKNKTQRTLRAGQHSLQWKEGETDTAHPADFGFNHQNSVEKKKGKMNQAGVVIVVFLVGCYWKSKQQQHSPAKIFLNLPTL